MKKFQAKKLIAVCLTLHLHCPHRPKYFHNHRMLYFELQKKDEYDDVDNDDNDDNDDNNFFFSGLC